MLLVKRLVLFLCTPVALNLKLSTWKRTSMAQVDDTYPKAAPPLFTHRVRNLSVLIDTYQY